MPWWIVENTLVAATLALLIALVSRAKRVPPVVRHGLWLVVLIKLIIPPVFSLGISVPGNWLVGRDERDDSEVVSQNDNADPPGETNPLQIGVRPPLTASTAIDALPENEMSISGLFGPFVPSDDSRPEEVEAKAADLVSVTDPATPEVDLRPTQPRVLEPMIRPAAVPISAASLLFWGALAGTLLVVLVQVVRLIRLRRILNRTRAAPEDLATLVAELATKLNVHSPAVRFSADIQSPLVCALGPAVLLWPSSRLASLRASARQAVIVHELAHLARRDHWIGWLELAASCAWWWNPLFWYVRHQLHENAELACDAWVTGLFPEARRSYARALVDLAEFDSLATTTVPALGVGDGSRKLFERRLVMIMGDRVRYRLGGLGFIGMGLLALVALPGCTAGWAAEEPVPSDSLPAVSVETGAPVTSPPAPGIDGANPFTTPTIVLQEPGPPAGIVPAVGPQPIALDESSERTTPVAEPGTSVLSGATRAMDPAAASNDDRLKRLEDRLETLLLELRELKSGDKAGAVPAIPPKPAKLPKQNTVNPLIPTTPGTDPRPAMDSKMQMQIDMLNRYVAKATRADGAVDAVTLTRSTYKLPPGKADEIAAFLKENLTDDIEVRVKDHNLQVTASAEDQTAIASFVRLLQTRGTAATKHKASEQLRRNSSGAPKGSRDANPDYDFEGSDADAFVPRKNRAPDAARDRGRPIGF